MRIMVNNNYCLFFSFVTTHIEKFTDEIFDKSDRYGGPMVVDSSAEVTCSPNVSLRANFAVNEIDAVVCAGKRCRYDT